MTLNIATRLSVKEVLALSIMVYETFGFVRSNQGYYKEMEDGSIVKVNDSKTELLNLIDTDVKPTEDQIKKSEQIIDKFNQKYMVKKLSGNLNSFEQNVSNAFSDSPLTVFDIAILASIPNMNEVDKKRQIVEDELERVRFTSQFYGIVRQRYEIKVKVLDCKYIQTSGVYMITTLREDQDIIKFWWRDQPDLSEIIEGRELMIRGTVNRHEKGRFSGAQETMMNRVKIISN
jgi:hypothetical protein